VRSHLQLPHQVRLLRKGVLQPIQLPQKLDVSRPHRHTATTAAAAVAACEAACGLQAAQLPAQAIELVLMRRQPQPHRRRERRRGGGLCLCNGGGQQRRMHGPNGGERKHSSAAAAGCREREGPEHPTTRSATAAVASTALSWVRAAAASVTSRVSGSTVRTAGAKVASAVWTPAPARVAASVVCRLLPVRMRVEAAVMESTLLLLLLVVKHVIAVCRWLSVTGVAPWSCGMRAGPVADAAAAPGACMSLAAHLTQEAAIAAAAACASLRLLLPSGGG
jgi:hypothetical protein